MMDGPKEDETWPIVVEQKEEPAYCMLIEEDKGMNGEGEWYLDIYSTSRMGHIQSLQTTITNWPLEDCPLTILFVVSGFTKDHMAGFISFVWLPRKRNK